MTTCCTVLIFLWLRQKLPGAGKNKLRKIISYCLSGKIAEFSLNALSLVLNNYTHHKLVFFKQWHKASKSLRIIFPHTSHTGVSWANRKAISFEAFLSCLPNQTLKNSIERKELFFPNDVWCKYCPCSVPNLKQCQGSWLKSQIRSSKGSAAKFWKNMWGNTFNQHRKTNVLSS